jgi:hypothetical protein
MKITYKIIGLTLVTICLLVIPVLSKEQVALTIYVHRGSPNGTMLSGVDITGQDAAGVDFKGSTDSQGVAVIKGSPGTWNFTFTKDDYNSLNLNYDVSKTDECATVLFKTGEFPDKMPIPKEDNANPPKMDKSKMPPTPENLKDPQGHKIMMGNISAMNGQYPMKGPNGEDFYPPNSQ